MKAVPLLNNPQKGCPGEASRESDFCGFAISFGVRTFGRVQHASIRRDDPPRREAQRTRADSNSSGTRPDHCAADGAARKIDGCQFRVAQQRWIADSRIELEEAPEFV